MEERPRVAGIRRRGELLESAIRHAVLELLASTGYDAMTMEEIAHRAHTGKAALYRRWPAKSELVLDTLVRFVTPNTPLPDTGGLRGDLLAVLGAVADSMDEPIARGAAAALAEISAAPTRKSALRVRFLAQRRDALLSVLQRAVDRGEIPGPARLAVAETALAMLIYRLLADGLPISREAIEALVDQVVLPLASASPGRP
ncbi:MAG: TetR/AcrR family transcriptional regulator [Mycobacteriales bacterium]